MVATGPSLPHSGGMKDGDKLAEVAALVGDPARANILCALLDGRALTASELSFVAGVTAQTTSGHLAKLVAAKLILPRKDGRHRYYCIAGAPISVMLESIMNVAQSGAPRYQPKSKADAGLRLARLCYDHIAGQLGVGLTSRLVEGGFVVLGEEAGAVSPAGDRLLSGLGVDLSSARAQRRIFCRPCLDWTERRFHIGGAVGAALANRLFELKWIERSPHGRALTITPTGYRGFRDALSFTLEPAIHLVDAK
jgi:DNA-binding transcriptional ArsR family regulator